MKAVSWVRARPKAFASAAAVTAGAVAISVLALAYDGNPTTEVDLHDGGVWITKTSNLLVGHFNHESTVIDSGLRTSGESFDILQSAATVLVIDEQENTLTSVDPARVALTDDATIPGDAKVALGNNTVAVLDRSSGSLWVAPAQGLSALEIQGTDPIAELGHGADVTVGTDGTIHAVSAKDSTIVTITVDAEGEPQDPSVSELAELDERAFPSITVVGSTPVVFDDATGTVHTTSGLHTSIGRSGAVVLQQPSAEADAVTLATASHLVQVPLDGSEPTEIASGGQGTPAAPVHLLGCTYGAWAGSAKFVRDCVSDDNDLVSDIADLDDTAELVFRVNRDVVVLNDVVGGAAWLATESLQRVDNWNDITPPEGDSEEDEQTTEETIETTLPERSEQNTDPIAVDDSFGVRPGRSTVLPVLDNDMDADGDVLVASLEGDQPSLGEVQPIQNGGALQITVPEGAAGTASFTYKVDDGRTGTDTATVRLTVHDWSTNSAPVQKRSTAIAVELGGTVSYNVLPDWIDPNGDDIYLRTVIPADGDEVDFTTDGQITYRALGTLLGRKEVEVRVADGLGEIASGTLILDVRPQGSTLPKTNADHVVTRVGQQVTVAPLANDTSSGREPLRLARVDEVPDTRITADFANKTFDFVSDKAGVYYVQYLVTAGPTPVPGLVRVDVLEPDDSDLAPIAVRDVALLPSGGEVLVGVLNNDTEPSGGILVVQSVSVDPGSGVSVSVLGHETLRISDQGLLDEQVHLTYRISNGSHTAEGDVIVIPISAPDKLLPPIVNDDQVVVRAGDVVTIPVLDNDSHPNNDTLTVAPISSRR
ncbi:Ig-like domain-containing protein [Microbacterium sp. NIBRBAC000506063]|uniref:Ig-like domain-containing protein n=1 Tax=Microbacterium sp. NIBRBAC000506063 TaxID=2734618 RepID=UPI001CB7252D|nr:Ig-like domain-containing protein [Microbacterium sp. NIBRBAC000506063]